MSYKFKAYSHPNITAKHKTTIEFTKDKHLTLKGDCIIGVNADFSLTKIKEFINNLKNKNIKIIMKNKDLVEEIHCEVNPEFNHETEMVIRKSEFKDKRTFGIRADKSAQNLSKSFIKPLSSAKQKISVFVEKSS